VEKPVRITSRGQVTIPADIRKSLGFLPAVEVEFEIDGAELRIRKADVRRMRGRDIVAAMRGRATSGMTTDEIMALTRGDG